MIFLVACTSGATDSGVGTPGARGDTSEAFPAPEIPPELDLAGVEAAFREASTQGLVWPLDLHAWFEGLMDDSLAGAGSCPVRVFSKDDPETWTSYWSGPCTGRHYTILGVWIAYVTRRASADGEELIATDLWSLTGEVTASGEEVYAGGHADIEWTRTGDTASFATFYGGQYRDPLWHGAIAAGTEGGIQISGEVDETSGFSGVVNGGVMGGSAYIEFRDVAYAGMLPTSGEVGVRDPSSGWWTLSVGPDGCGAVAWGAEVVGDTCVVAESGPLFDAAARASLAAHP